MVEKKVPYLAGCVFYLLLRKAAYDPTSARQRQVGVKDDHKNPIFMADLVYTFTGYQTVGSSSDTSNYREGKSEGTVNVPFNDTSYIASYDNVVRNRYQDALKRMDEFVTWHLNPDKREWFVKALLDVIDNDEDILETDEFCFKSDGSFMTKAELRTESFFEYQPFLVGVLHFILMRRAGKNELGIPTLDAITEKVKSKERQYNGHLGESITRTIKVDFYKEPSAEDKMSNVPDKAEEEIVLQPDAIIEESDDEIIRDAMGRSAAAVAAVLSAVPQPKIDMEVLAESLRPVAAAMDSYRISDEQAENMSRVVATAMKATNHAVTEGIRESRRKEKTASQADTPDADTTEENGASEDKKTTIIQQQTNVIQNGDNNVNVTNNGTINLNF